MIKIVSHSSTPAGDIVALVTLCRLLNAAGHTCVLYAPDRWHLDKCPSETLDDFRPTKGDTIVVNGLPLTSASGLHGLTQLIEKNRGKSWKHFLRNISLRGFRRDKPPVDFQLVLTCQERSFRPRHTNLSLYHKIHISNDGRHVSTDTQLPTFICPNPVDSLHQSPRKPTRTAGIIGSIRRENRIEDSIKRAFKDGMDRVIIFGYLADPVYYYSTVRPVLEKHPRKVQFAGFVDDRQALYNSISDAYCSPDNPCSSVRVESSMTGTHFHGGSHAPQAAMDNDQIVALWLKELGLAK